MESQWTFSEKPQSWVKPLLILVAATLLLMTFQLDGTPFRGIYDDVDRSLIARNMLDSNDWLVARYVYGPLYTKPPLMYWTAASIGALTGRLDELPGNLASVLGMFTVVLCTFWAGRNLFGNRAGLWAGLLLVTMHLFLAMSRQALLDTVMMGGFGLTFGALIHLGFSGTQRSTFWWLVIALGLGLSFMTKGPVILPVFLLIWLPMLRTTPQARPHGQQILWVLLVILAVILPWPIVLLNAAPEAVEVWKSELFGRFGDGQQFLEWTQKPFWFYLPDLANTMPWLIFLGWSVVRAFRERKSPRWQMLLWWAVGGLVFFSLASSTKRSYYLLPLYPAFALLIAGQWEVLVQHLEKKRSQRPPVAPLINLALLVLMGLAMVVLPFVFPGVPPFPFILGGLVLLGAGSAALYSWRQNQGARALNLALLGAVSLHLAYFGYIVPQVNTYHSGKPFYLEARPLIGDQEVVLLDVNLSLSVFYLHQVPWKYAKVSTFTKAMSQSRGDLVVASAQAADKIEHLVPVLEKEFTEPFGKKKKLGLYRFQPPQLPSDD